MSPSRRSFLRTSVPASLVGALGLAGCLTAPESSDGTGDERPSYSRWFYDPSVMLSAEYSVFGTADPSHLRAHDDVVPDRFTKRLASFARPVDGIDVDSVTEVTGITSRDPDRHAAGGSLALTGSFDPEAIAASLETALDVDFERTTHDGYTLHTGTLGEMDYEAIEPLRTITIAASSDRVLFGGMQAPEATSTDAVTGMLSARNGDRERFVEADDHANELVTRLGDAPIVGGAVFDSDLVQYANENTADELVDVATDLVALGVATTIDGDTVDHTVGLTYRDGNTPSTKTIESAIDRVTARVAVASTQFDDVSIDASGRTALVSTTGNAEAFFDLLGFLWLPANGPGP